MNRTIERVVIYLKEDLKLADTLQETREKLLKSITDKSYFSESLVAYFVKKDAGPYVISPDDPSQVAVLKKILNSFADAERTFRAIEQLNIDPKTGGQVFKVANLVGLGEVAKTAELVIGVGKIYYDNISKVYAALQLLNHANADIQNIVGPHLQALMPSLALAQNKLDALTPSFPAESAGVFFAEVAKEVPKHSQDENSWVASLPSYFAQLQKIVAQAAVSKPFDPKTNAAAQQEAMFKQAQETKAYFDGLVASQEGLLSTTGTYINYFKLMSDLAAQSAAILQTSSQKPQVFLDVEQHLEKLKHHYLPLVVGELEKIEESIGLRTGLLTDLAMVQMNNYYGLLATTVQSVAHKAGAASKTELAIMEDEGFRITRFMLQEERLSVARLASDNTEPHEAAERFFARLNSYGSLYQAYCKWSIANISQEEKEAFIADYKKFQPHLAAIKPELDKLIVDALTMPTGTSVISRLWTAQYKQLWGSNHFSEALACKKEVLESIAQSQAQAKFQATLIGNSLQHVGRPNTTDDLTALVNNNFAAKKQALRLANEARDKAPLVTKAPDFERRTLFAMLHDLQLSQSVEQFIEGKLETYLQAHLSPVVWRQLAPNGKLVFSKLPYTQLHQDSSDVVVYKQLINSIYHLHEGLKKLEQIDRNNPSNIFARWRYLSSTYNTLLMTLNHSRCYLNEAAQNPGLQAIVEESLALLEPLKNLPLLGDYLQAPAQPSAKKDVLELWREQRELVERARSPQPKPVKPVQPVVVEQAQQASYVRGIAEALAQLPSNISAQQQEAEVNTLVAGLKALSFGPESIEGILAATSKLQKKLAALSSGSPELRMAHLKEIRSEFGFIFMAAANKAEFELGLKTGTYSTVVREQFNRFYEALVGALPLASAQMGLELILDISYMRKLLEQEKQQLALAEDDQKPQATRALLFGENFVEEQTIYNAYRELRELNSSIASFDLLGPMELDDFHNDALPIYATLQPFLVKIDPQFTKEFIANIQELQQLGTALKQIAAAQASIFKPTTALAMMCQLELENKLAERSAQEVFLKAYQELQPYLVKINPSYDLTYFLRELQEPKDFVSAITKIIAESEHLEELIGGLNKTRESKINLARERVMHFETLVKQRVEELGPQRIEAFKEKVYSNYVGANVESYIAMTLGATQAELFVQHAMPDFKDMKDAVLHGVSINGAKDIETSIAERVDAKLATIIAANTASFKNLLFTNYLEQNLKAQSDAVLGSENLYKDLFFKQIAPFYQEVREQLLSDLAFDANLSTRLAVRLGSKHAAVMEVHEVLKNDFVALNAFAVQLKARIAIDQGLEQTSERRATLDGLTTLLESLDVKRVDASNPGECLKEAKRTLGFILYNSQLAVIREQWEEQLGDYASLFLKKVAPLYAEKSIEIVANAIGKEDIDEHIREQLRTFTQEIESKVGDLKAALSVLNTFAHQLTATIKEEQDKPNNPSCGEKIELLLQLNQSIHESIGLHRVDSNWALGKYKDAQRQLANIAEYDALIQINELLANLERSIPQEQAMEEVKVGRLQAVNDLKGILNNRELKIQDRVSTVMVKLSELNLEYDLDVFKKFFFEVIIKKEEEKQRLVLGEFTACFMTVVADDWKRDKATIIREMLAKSAEDEMQHYLAEQLAELLSKHQALHMVCETLNTSLNALYASIEPLNLVVRNSCQDEKFQRLNTMSTKLLTSALANESLAELKSKQAEVVALKAFLVLCDQLIELYRLLTKMRTYVTQGPASALKEKKLEALNQFQTILEDKDKPPLARFLALSEVNKQVYSTLSKNADNIFVRLYNGFIDLVTKVLDKLLNRTPSMKVQYHADLSLFKNKVGRFKVGLDNLKSDDDPLELDKGPKSP